MRQLLLLRHAKSSWDEPGLSDHARPLSDRGRKAAAAMRQAMRDLGLAPDVVLVSSSRRTLQTLHALEPWDETPMIEMMDTLYLASAARMLQVLQGVAETARSVLLLGHNPGIHELAAQLAGGTVNEAQFVAGQRLARGYPSGALAEFSVAGPWAQLDQDSATLLRFLCPKDLPELAA